MSLQNGRGKPLENMIYENVWGYFLIHFYVMRSAAVSSLGTWASHKLLYTTKLRKEKLNFLSLRIKGYMDIREWMILLGM